MSKMGTLSYVEVSNIKVVVTGHIEVAGDKDVADVEDEAVCGESHYRVNEPSLPLSQF